MKIKKEVLDKCKTHEQHVHEMLQDEEYRREYLRLTLEEYVEDGDYAFFFKELEKIVKAKTSIAKLAKDTNLNRSNLSNILKGKVQPSFDTTMKILRSLGAEIEVKFA